MIRPAIGLSLDFSNFAGFCSLSGVLMA